MYTIFTMPITKSVKKSWRVSEKRKIFNLRRKQTLKRAVKAVRAQIANPTDEAAQALQTAFKAIDKAAKRGIIHQNTANLKTARLSKALAAKRETK